MGFYCSEKFRLNSNSQKVDIWLIYKCSKCDTTWKLSLMRGIRPSDLTPEIFDKLTNNDKELAWQYAFDKQLLKQSGYVIDCTGVDYCVDRFRDPGSEEPICVRLISQYFFDLKLSTFLAKQLGISVGEVRKLAQQNLISTSLDCDIMKYRIRTDFTITLHQPFCNPQ